LEAKQLLEAIAAKLKRTPWNVVKEAKMI